MRPRSGNIDGSAIRGAGGGKMRKIVLAASLSLVAALSATPSHAVVNTVISGPGAFVAGFAPPTVIAVSSQDSTYVNLDIEVHNVVSVAKKPGSTTVPLFKTGNIGTGATAVIEGAKGLAVGEYPFVCSLHANTMKGTLKVVA
jgi:plastocyanin